MNESGLGAWFNVTEPQTSSPVTRKISLGMYGRQMPLIYSHALTPSGFAQPFAAPSDLRLQCRDIDQPVAALIRDLKQRGLLDETLLHQIGINHTRLTYRFQGRDFRLTDVHGRVVNEILS